MHGPGTTLESLHQQNKSHDTDGKAAFTGVSRLLLTLLKQAIVPASINVPTDMHDVKTHNNSSDAQLLEELIKPLICPTHNNFRTMHCTMVIIFIKSPKADFLSS